MIQPSKQGHLQSFVTGLAHALTLAF